MTSFGGFILYNQGRDLFMEVESDRHLQFSAIYESCRMASACVGSEWKIESLKDLYAMDKQQWADDYVMLHEGTLDHALKQIEALFIPLLRQVIKLVTVDEADYWRHRDRVFYRLCGNGELEWTLKDLERRIAPT